MIPNPNLKFKALLPGTDKFGTSGPYGTLCRTLELELRGFLTFGTPQSRIPKQLNLRTVELRNIGGAPAFHGGLSLPRRRGEPLLETEEYNLSWNEKTAAKTQTWKASNLAGKGLLNTTRFLKPCAALGVSGKSKRPFKGLCHSNSSRICRKDRTFKALWLPDRRTGPGALRHCIEGRKSLISQSCPDQNQNPISRLCGQKIKLNCQWSPLSRHVSITSVSSDKPSMVIQIVPGLGDGTHLR